MTSARDQAAEASRQVPLRGGRALQLADCVCASARRRCLTLTPLLGAFGITLHLGLAGAAAHAQARQAALRSAGGCACVCAPRLCAGLRRLRRAHGAGRGAARAAVAARGLGASVGSTRVRRRALAASWRRRLFDCCRLRGRLHTVRAATPSYAYHTLGTLTMTLGAQCPTHYPDIETA